MRAEPAAGTSGKSFLQIGRSAHDKGCHADDDCSQMDEPGILHRIEDDLSESWVEELTDSGVEKIEEYLAKHLAFLSYLEDVTTA